MKDFLRRISLFKELDDEQLGRLASLMEEERHPAYKLIFREGDPVDAFYMVREGMVTMEYVQILMYRHDRADAPPAS